MSFGVGVGDLVAVSNLASKLRKQFIDSPDQFKDICHEIKSLSNVLRDVEELLPERDLTDTQKTDLEHHIEGCQDVLAALDKVLINYRGLDSKPKGIGEKSRKVWKRLKWEPDDIKELRLRVVENIGFLNSFSAAITSKLSSETKQGVDELRRHNNDAENQTIVDWLTPIDYAAQQSDFIGRRQKGTGQWLLDSDEFQRWQNDRKQTLFCPGIPGAGKTMITSIVIDHLCNTFQNEADIGVAYLYCNYRRKEEQSPDQLLLSLVKQLVQELPSVPDGVKSLYERHKKKRTRPSFDEISTVLHSVAVEYSKVFIVIDALDECYSSDGYRQKLLSEIFSLQTKTTTNVFGTSRFIPEITRQFQESISLEIRASDDDVRKYLDGKMSLLRPFVSRNLALQEEIKTEIINAVDGMFLLAQLHMDSLGDRTSAKLVKLALKTLPKGSGSEALDSAYKEAMERIEAQERGLQDLAKRTLSWIILASRPLTTSELLHALAVEIGEPELDQDNLVEVEEMISVCAGLVTFDEESDIIRLVHYTTQEYFERTWESWFPKAQDDITKTCLTYLSFRTFLIGFSPTVEEDDELKKLWELKDKKFLAMVEPYPLYEYAALNWGHHASTASMDTKEMILQFLEHSASQLTVKFGYGLWFPYGGNFQSPQVKGIHLAAHFGLIEVMETLLKGGCNPDLRDSYCCTPLSWASANGRAAAVKLLLATDGVNPNSYNLSRHTPLRFAAANGHEEVVKLLLAEGDIDPDLKDDSGGTPLYIAARNGQEVVVKLLLAHERIDINSKNKNGSTPLSIAVDCGHEAVVRLLLGMKDIDVNYKTNNGWTPLGLAIKHGRKGIARLLLEHIDIDVNSRNQGETALSLAATSGCAETVRLLLDRRDIHVNSRDGWKSSSALGLAAEHGHEGIIRLLLEREDIDINITDKTRRTPLAHAARKGDEAVVRLLLVREDVDINCSHEAGWVPLSLTASEGVARLLLTHKDVDVNSRDSRGRTPLHFAAFYGKKDVVRLLLEHEDVDIDAEDMDGVTPLRRAAMEGRNTVVELLLEHKSARDERMGLSTVSEAMREEVLKTLESAKRKRHYD